MGSCVRPRASLLRALLWLHLPGGEDKSPWSPGPPRTALYLPLLPASFLLCSGQPPTYLPVLSDSVPSQASALARLFPIVAILPINLVQLPAFYPSGMSPNVTSSERAPLTSLAKIKPQPLAAVLL